MTAFTGQLQSCMDSSKGMMAGDKCRILHLLKMEEDALSVRPGSPWAGVWEKGPPEAQPQAVGLVPQH